MPLRRAPSYPTPSEPRPRPAGTGRPVRRRPARRSSRAGRPSPCVTVLCASVFADDGLPSHGALTPLGSLRLRRHQKPEGVRKPCTRRNPPETPLVRPYGSGRPRCRTRFRPPWPARPARPRRPPGRANRGPGTGTCVSAAGATARRAWARSARGLPGGPWAREGSAGRVSGTRVAGTTGRSASRPPGLPASRLPGFPASRPPGRSCPTTGPSPPQGAPRGRRLGAGPGAVPAPGPPSCGGRPPPLGAAGLWGSGVSFGTRVGGPVARWWQGRAVVVPDGCVGRWWRGRWTRVVRCVAAWQGRPYGWQARAADGSRRSGRRALGECGARGRASPAGAAGQALGPARHRMRQGRGRGSMGAWQCGKPPVRPVRPGRQECPGRPA